MKDAEPLTHALEEALKEMEAAPPGAKAAMNAKNRLVDLLYLKQVSDVVDDEAVLLAKIAAEGEPEP